MTLPPPIEYKGWRLIEDEEGDSDGFYTAEYYAEKDGERKSLHHSRFRFTPTLERFAFLIDAGFPSFPPHCVERGLYHPWSDEDVDAEIEKLRRQP